MRAKERHADIHALLDSINNHTEIPSTFDGSNPYLTFAQDGGHASLKIGSQYMIPDGDGGEVEAVLEEASVLETEQRAYCIYRTADGKRWICTNDLTDDEIAAYRLHPETFFGVQKNVGGKIDTMTDAFEFIFETYQKTPKRMLLEWMKDAPDFQRLKNMSQRDIAITYSERLAFKIISDSAKQPKNAA